MKQKQLEKLERIEKLQSIAHEMAIDLFLELKGSEGEESSSAKKVWKALELSAKADLILGNMIAEEEALQEVE